MHGWSCLVIRLDKGDAGRDFTVIGTNDKSGARAGFAQHAFELEVRYYIGIFGQAEAFINPVEGAFDSRRDDHGISGKFDRFILQFEPDGFGLALGPAQGAPEASAAAKAPFRFLKRSFFVEPQLHLVIVVPALLYLDFNELLARGGNIPEFYYESAFVFVLHRFPHLKPLHAGFRRHDEYPAVRFLNLLSPSSRLSPV
jgi:hypothetical protein